MTPSVEGTRKLRVGALLVLSAGVTAALAGFAGGLVWDVSPLPGLTGGLVVGLVSLGVVLDIAHRATGRLRPPAVGRQVPQEWSRVFDPSVVAVLYGARLGIGPLTILSSWLWWALFVLGASGGPLVGAGVGAAFAVSRTVVMIGVAEWARGAMAGRMGRIRVAEPSAHAASSVAAIGLAAVLTLL